MTAPAGARPAIRRVGWALGLLAAAAIAVEGLLQIGAAAIWFAYRRRPPAAADRPTVLCVGDSYTFGQGASNPGRSYPAELERLLRSRLDSSWRVVNAGWPGHSSRDVLQGLPRLLETSRPRLVYVLIGANDQWARPRRLEGQEADTDPWGFRWRWRTGRLLRVVAQHLVAVRARPRPVAAPQGNAAQPASTRRDAVIGQWYAGRDSLRIQVDGYVVWGTSRWPWTLEGNEVVVTRPGQAAVRLRATMFENRPVLAGENRGRAFRLERDARATTVESQLARIRALQGRPAELARYVQELRQAWAARADEAQAEVLLEALELTGETREALRTAETVVARFPDLSTGWRVLGWQAYLAGQTERGLAASARAIAVANDDAHRVAALFIQGRIAMDDDPRLAVASHVRAWQITGSDQALGGQLIINLRTVPRSLFDEVVAGLGLSRAQREAVTRIYIQAAEADPATMVATYRAHLDAIARQVRASGAQPVFLSYPFLKPDLEGAARAAALAGGAGWVDVRPVFDSLLQRRPRRDLFVPDGHLNDAGYAVLGGLVADDAARRLAVP